MTDSTYLCEQMLAAMLGFVPLPPLYWLLLAITLVGYGIMTQLVKKWFYHKFGD